VKIEVYSDIACPWCYLGERRLARALKRFPGRGDVEVVFRPFQLDPTLSDRAVPLLADLERKFGANARAMTERITETGSNEGIDFDWTHALAVNTLTAHRLLRLAETKAEIATAHDLGVTAVPTFIIDEQYAVQGAQPPEIFLQVLEQVAAESTVSE
jgi:predicted DsbA family dithiol-disulfide isomerase